MIKRITLFISTAVLIIAIFVPYRVTGEVKAAAIAPSESYFADKLEQNFPMPPVKIILPRLGLAEQLVRLGVGADGVMETPADYAQLGYFTRSALLGEVGNVVIAGHYDDSHGRPAVFWELKNVEVNDKVVLIDKYDRQYVYQVTDSFLVGINDSNRLQVIQKESDEHVLTLITCGGVWDPISGTYTKRLVVQAKLL